MKLLEKHKTADSAPRAQLLSETHLCWLQPRCIFLAAHEEPLLMRCWGR